MRDLLSVDILRRIDKKFVSVFYKSNNGEERNIFEFFSSEKEVAENLKYFNLFNKIFIIEYIDKNYFFYNAVEKFKHIIKTKSKIFSFLYDLTLKALHSDGLIILIKSEKSGNKYILKKLHFHKFFRSDLDLQSFTRLYVNTEKKQFESMKRNFPFLTFYEIDSSHFILMNKHSAILYEKFTNSSVAIQVLDLSFTTLPFPHLNNNKEFFVMSSEYFLYKLQISEKHKSSFTIFKELTLNFNNEKYKEMLEYLKLLIFYKIEVDKVDFSELKNFTKEIFNQFDIFTYVENLSHVLNEENIQFFLNYNLNSYKLLAIFVFCLIFENYKFLRKIFKLIIFNSNSKNEKSYKENLTFVSYLILFEDFLLDFFNEDFEKIDRKNLMLDFNKNLFQEFDGSILTYLNDYIHNRITKIEK